MESHHTPRPAQHFRATLSQVAEALKAAMPPGALPHRVITGVSTDSRDVPNQAMFVALVGEKFDGHTFLGQLPPRTPLALVQADHIATCAPTSIPTIVVSDTLVALGELARWHRAQFTGPVVAITGSAGKTTTKELTAHVLATRGQVLKTEGNLNNRIGVPLTLFGLSSHHFAAVVEAGISLPGEMAALRQIIEPTVRVVLNAALAHVQFLRDETGVAAEKSQLFDDARPTDILVFNADDPRIAAEAGRRTGGRKIAFGKSPTADVRAANITPMGEQGTRFTLSHGGLQVDVTLPLIGGHHVSNALAATAVGIAVGLSLNDIASALSGAHLELGGRSRIVHLEAETLLIDDTYNSNPQSAGAAVTALKDLAEKTSRPVTIAILGDMLELGDSGPNAHREIGNTLAAAGVTHVLTFGPLSQHTAEAARSAGVPTTRVHSFLDKSALIATALGLIEPRSCILVKGSRGMRMEEVVSALTGKLSQQPRQGSA